MRLIHVIGAFLFVIASPAMAKDAATAWVVAQKSGDVRVIKNGLQPASVQLRDSLSAGEVLVTGPTGRAMLTRGGDYVVVSPGSRLLLPKEEETKGFTRLIQQVGTMLYKVRHTGVPHFAVNTPMLAAVVKGTTFTVVVDKDRAAVQVTEGKVEVSSLNGTARRLVEGGMTVYVGRERPDLIVPMKPGQAVAPSPATVSPGVKVESSGDVPLSTVTDLTGGLVREAPTTPVVAASTPVADAIRTTNPIAGELVEKAALTVTEPGVAVVDTTVPVVAQPVVSVVDTLVPPVTDPLVNIVDTTVTEVAQPVVDVVGNVIPAITQPVVDIVDTTVPAVLQPVVNVVDNTVPAVTQPVVEIVDTVTQPVVEIVDSVTSPVVDLLNGNSGPGSSNSGPGGGGSSGSGGGGNSGPGGGDLVGVITQPVVEVVDTTVPAVVEPVVNVVETVTQPVTGLLGGIFGKP